MPLMGTRKYELNITSFGPTRSGMIGHLETLTASIGHIGTQFDGLGHIGKRMNIEGKEKDVYYNGFEREEVYAPGGLKKIGVENVKPIVTRGILIDIAGYKEQSTLDNGYVVTLEEVKEALKSQNIDEATIKEGDAVLFNFGWWKIIKDKDRYASFNKAPGIDKSVINWIIEKKVVLIGSDTYADPPGKWDVHLELLMKNGIYNLEFMTFESLLEDEVYDFLFIVTPLRLKGANVPPCALLQFTKLMKN